jgi:hypothetical protein
MWCGRLRGITQNIKRIFESAIINTKFNYIIIDYKIVVLYTM